MADSKEDQDRTNGAQPSVNVKLDGPEESSENSTNEEIEGLSTENDSDTKPTSSDEKSPEKGSSGVSSRVVAASRFGHSFGSSESERQKSSLLRPSQLNVTNLANNQSSATPKLVLQPAKLQNPFKKLSDGTREETSEAEAKAEAKNNSGEASSENPMGEAKPKFIPLVSSTKDNENSVNNAMPSNASTPSFVFGQNLKERVAVGHDGEVPESAEEENKSEASNENGSSELLFSNAAAICCTTSRPGLTLSQAAQELEEATRANKRKYSEVQLLTGEEGETNVLQINCKLFAYDKSSWQERGRGTLRLNDRDEESRLVGRTTGTQKVILNTKVWPGMTVEKAAAKSLRLTAMDVHGDIRIFVVQAAPKEIDQLHSLLLQRLKRAQERQPKKVATDMDH